MTAPVQYKVACVHCGAHIAFAPEALGTIIDCPDCRLSTPLEIPHFQNLGFKHVQAHQQKFVHGIWPFAATPAMDDALPETWQSAARPPSPANTPLARTAATADWLTRPRKLSKRGWLITLIILATLTAIRPMIVGILVFLTAVILIYFLPALVGRNQRNALGILILNTFLGWTLVGWVAALVWACTVEDREKKSA